MRSRKRGTDNPVRIACFACNWGGYSGIEMAGANRMQYPPGIRMVRLPCLGRLHLGNLLKAFELGADGVIMLGCLSRECNYDSGMQRAKELYDCMREMMRLLGIDQKRLHLKEVPVGDGALVAKELNAFHRRIHKLSGKQAVKK